MSVDYNTSVESKAYYTKLNQYIIESPGRLYTFEISKFCGYSTIIFMYKDETMLDLWNRVSHHFGCHDIKGLYIDSYLNKNSSNNSSNSNPNAGNVCNDKNKCCCCADKSGKYIPVPMSSLKKVREFVFENTAKDPRNMEPIYPLPLPVVYRIYLDDGHCHGLI